LERQRWSEAADLDPWLPNDYPIDKFPAMEAITYFARALGAARDGNLKLANQALEKRMELHKKIEKTSDCWAQQIEIQRQSVMAWIMY
jgi:hypothetical protein